MRASSGLTGSDDPARDKALGDKGGYGASVFIVRGTKKLASTGQDDSASTITYSAEQ